MPGIPGKDGIPGLDGRAGVKGVRGDDCGICPPGLFLFNYTFNLEH